MSLFSKFEQLAASRQLLAERGLDPFSVVVEKIISPTEAVVAGRRMVMAGTNNYLGLTFAPECIAAALKAVEEEGTGTTGSRMANGSYAGHEALERELAAFYNCPSAIVFSTGYQANLGILSTLLGPGDVVLLDGDAHASIYDGCRQSGAEAIRFRHNDVNDLDKRLRRLGDRAANALILVEGIYSMLGDRAPLADIVGVKEKYGAYLLVDEAHSLGVFGEHGRGLAEEVGVEDQVDLITGTFSKSLAGIGGFCVSRLPELENLRYACRAYVFTASSSPGVIAATRAALGVLQARPELRERLWRNAHQFYGGVQALGFTVGPEPTPVVAVLMKDRDQALALWSGLMARGIYVNMAFPPATPDNMYLFRCSVSAAHTPEQIDFILGAFASLQSVLQNKEE